MTTLEFNNLASALLPAVLEAGALQLKLFRAGGDVERKADGSPVTAADQRSELILTRALNTIAPGVPVIAEEAVAAGRRDSPGDTYFLVDPLDGTRQFIEGVPEFTINIGLIENRRPVFGLIYAPALSAFFVTRGGGGAVSATIAPDQTPSSLTGLDLVAIRTREAPESGPEAYVSRSHEKPENQAFLAGHGVSRQHQVGSSLKFCLIARGDGDLYARLGQTCQWDTAAGQAILEVAGGAVLTLDGRRLEYGNETGTWNNPHFVAWGRRPADGAG